MEEGREGPPKGKSWLELARRVVGELKEGIRSLDVKPKVVPLEKINEQTVAEAILNFQNPLRERFGKEKWSTFSVRDLLIQLGHVPFWSETDPYEVFPEEHRAVRQVLPTLVSQGVINEIKLEEPDEYKQRIYYKVNNESLLREIAGR